MSRFLSFDIYEASPLKSSLADIKDNLTYFLNSLIYVLPVNILMSYLSFSVTGKLKEQTQILSINGKLKINISQDFHDSVSTENTISLLLLIPVIIVNLSFVLGWHKKFLTGENVIHHPWQLTREFWLFLWKSLAVPLFVLLHFLPLFILCFIVIIGATITGNSSSAYPLLIDIAILLIGGIVILYKTIGFAFALPAAASGENMTLITANRESKSCL